MLRIVVTICAVSHLVTAMPQQRPVQQQIVGVRPGVNGATASPLSAYGPSYSQQLAFGAAPQASLVQQPQQQQQTSGSASPQIRRVPQAYQTAQPILISQASPSASPATSGSTFASFPGAQFAGAGRQILTLRSPTQSQTAADEDEYEYEDDDEPTIHARPTPSPQRNAVTRAPVRVASPTPSLGFGAGGPGRFAAQPQQQQRQRQPIQQQPLAIQAAPQQSQRLAPQQGGQNLRPAPGAQFGIDGKRSRLTTPPPIQTVNRYMKQNDDGSITWGYENEDGTFKEETLGADCVVRGKYGYIDPEGNKREYEYQTGNPCDPNKKDQEEEVEEEEDLPDGPSRQQQIAGVLNARPRPVQRRPVQGIPQYQAQPQYQIS